MRRSPLSATASSSRRAGPDSRATRVPSMSSTASGTGMSSPISGGPCSTSVRPTSSANSGLPSVDSTIRRSSCRDRLSPSRSDSRRRVAPRLSGPTSRRSSALRSSARSRADRRPGRLASRKPTALVLEPASRERERVRRRTIEPLDVVDRDQQRPAGGQRAQPIQQAERRSHAARGGDVRRLGPQQRHLQRDALRSRQTRQLPSRSRRTGRSAPQTTAAPRHRSAAPTAPAARARAQRSIPASHRSSCRSPARP